MKVAFFLLGTCLVLMGFVLNRRYMKKVVSFFSIYWFRFACSFFVLFLLNVGLGFLGVFVPINLASAIVLTLLGFPGFIAIISIVIFL